MVDLYTPETLYDSHGTPYHNHMARQDDSTEDDMLYVEYDDYKAAQSKIDAQSEVAQNQFALICRQEDKIGLLEKTCATLWAVLSGDDKLWDEANRKVGSQTNQEPK